jgi:Fur family transcriptional regulator, ferric uptake regulator
MDMQSDSSLEKSETNASSEVTQPNGRLTPARNTVLDILNATTKALTHHEVEQQARARGVRFDRVTLYRALDWLVGKAYVHKIAAEDRIWRFSAARASNCGAVAYFHCATCGEIQCLETKSNELPVQVPAGVRVQRAELMLTGHCARCPA